MTPEAPDEALTLWEFLHPPAWHLDASCKGQGPAAFVLARGDGEYNRKLCQTCPVRAECLEAALADPSLMGLWGGPRSSSGGSCGGGWREARRRLGDHLSSPERRWVYGYGRPSDTRCSTRPGHDADDTSVVVIADPNSQFAVHLGLVLRVGFGQPGCDVAKLEDEASDLFLRVSLPPGTAAPSSCSALSRSPWTSAIHPATTVASAPASSVWRYLARRWSQSAILRRDASARASDSSSASPAMARASHVASRFAGAKRVAIHSSSFGTIASSLT